MAVPEWIYTFTAPAVRKRIDVHGMLREWHRAGLLGLELQTLVKNGVEIDPVRVMMLNEWIACRGCSNATRQDYFEAWARLERVLTGTVPASFRKRKRP